jgi:putative membrane protein
MKTPEGGLMGDLYLWVKAGHVISVTAWMAALFYLPRLFVYHVERGTEVPALTPTFDVMERRLQKAIMTPAMIASWAFGLTMVAMGGVDWGLAWPWIKAGAVIAMTAFHMWCAAQRTALASGEGGMTGRAYRIANEVPTLLLVIIVVAVIVKPG